MSQLNFLEQLAAKRRPLSVSELTARLRNFVEREFVDLYVEGEISNFRRHSSGHWYFSLKDETASLRCASFRMQNRMIRFLPEDGLHVITRGRLSIYDARGEYQLVVEYMEPVGAGALQLALEQWALERAGLLEEETYRRGHRVRILQHAIAPLAATLPKPVHGTLHRALSVIFGIEPWVVLKDIWGISDREVERIALWMADAMIDAALREAQASAPPRARR